MSVYWLMPCVIAAATVLSLVGTRIRRRTPRSDAQVVIAVFAVANDDLASFRARRPHLLSVGDCLRWLDIRGYHGFKRPLLAEAKRQRKTNPGARLLAHVGVITKYGYVTSGLGA